MAFAEHISILVYHPKRDIQHIVRIMHYFAVSDIDYCLSSPCMNNATCIYQILGYECACATGYNGTVCEIGTQMTLENNYDVVTRRDNVFHDRLLLLMLRHVHLLIRVHIIISTRDLQNIIISNKFNQMTFLNPYRCIAAKVHHMSTFWINPFSI